jgi:hypothetical protein
MHVRRLTLPVVNPTNSQLCNPGFSMPSPAVLVLGVIDTVICIASLRSIQIKTIKSRVEVPSEVRKHFLGVETIFLVKK